MRYTLTFVLLATLAAPALALDAPDTIVVTANRTPQPLSRVGQTISIVDSAEIARRQTANVADILRTLPGVAIARNGGIGTTASVFIRGADSDQTVTLIDGVKLNDPASPGGGFNFGNLLVGNIDRIEVLRGSQSVLWGSQAIGGVINMITRQPTDALALNARGEYGYRDTGQLVANVSGRAGPLSASAGAGYFRTQGISAFSEARGGTERDGYENYGANANFNLALSDSISIDARGWLSRGDVGSDGFPPPNFAFADTLDTSTTREIVAYTGINAAFLDGRFRNRLGFAYTDTRRRNFDRDIETFASVGRNERFEYQGVFDISDGWQATAGLERETSRFRTTSGGAPTIGRARLDSIYGQLVATPLNGLTLTGGLRHDEHDRFGGATTFGGSGVYTLAATGTTLRASYAEGFKAPSLFQLQSDFGNQQLRPERSRGWDAGVAQSALDDTLDASITYFKRNTSDLIVFVSCPQPPAGICIDRPFGTYDNVAAARAEGVEIALGLRPVEALRVQANYTYTDATNRSPGNASFGKQLLRRPQDSVSALIDYRWPFGLETGATLTHVGRTFDNAANTTRLEGYVLADLRAAFPIGRGIEIYGRIENLFNERYETVLLYGQPGRAGYAGVRMRL
ncbi:vitamin B12 transporter [Polymorphobacter multimanifer]|uniref:Vitamin B12 transporter n=1 Tax=Polymorphobacter multimanifer TaxID=1070431 RepID=A0A841L1S5_9SPHN|nr:TonB-dependent receptor [Polymorphobacter multimanifer]MBB6226266.1 vitamin B12 transporter [Polymorphobacter multimanifer]